MLEMFYPDEYMNSTYDIDFEKYYEQGYRGIIFDIDNTLVPHDAPADDRAIELFDRLHKIGFKTMLLSNNKDVRVGPFAKAVDTDYIFKAQKPKRKNYILASNFMETGVDKTMFIGDQIFTDVWGAKRAGVHSILVKPINPKEEFQIVLKRILEKVILEKYEKEVLNK